LSLLLAACQPPSDAGPEPGSDSRPAATATGTASTAAATAGQASEDERLLAFFEEIFERDVSQSPEFQAELGRKTEDYGRWDDYSDEHAIELNAQTETDLQRLRSEFEFEKLGESARLSYRIFEYN